MQCNALNRAAVLETTEGLRTTELPAMHHASHLHRHHEREGHGSCEERHPDDLHAEVQDDKGLERGLPQMVHEQPAQLKALDVRRGQVHEVSGRGLREERRTG